MTATLTRISAIVVKEFRHLFRDPRTLAAALLLPVLELLLFAYAISFDVADVPTVVVDRDNTSVSRAYVDKYSASGLFAVRGSVPNERAAVEEFRKGRAQVALIVQPGFADAIVSGRTGEVGVLVNGSEPTAARMATTYSQALNARYGAELKVAWAQTHSMGAGAGGMPGSSVGTLEPRLRTWYNPDRLSSIFLIPGLLGVIIMVVTVQQTAVTLVREREQGTDEQMHVSPLRSWELMVGKLLPWVALAWIDAVAIVLIGMLGFGVPFRGSVIVLAVGITLFIASCLGMGLIVSAIVPTLSLANVVSMLISFLPAFLLSGFAFPLHAVPTWLQWVSHLFPVRYMVDLCRDVFLKGTGWTQSWPEIGQLALYLLVVLTIASLLQRRRTA